MFNPSYVGPRRDILALVPSAAREVLDVGCSVGTLGRAIHERDGARVVGIELDETMASEARAHLDRVHVGSVEDERLLDELGNEQFDCIIFADLLEHLVDPWTTLQRFAARLAPDGVVVVSLPNIRHYTTIRTLLFQGYWPYRDRGIHDRTHLRFFTLRNIRELFAAAGLEILEVDRNYRIVERPHRLNRLAPALAWPGLRELLAFQYLVRAGTSEALKISIACADLSGNCLGRSYILARVLERRYDVEIVGPAFGDGLWEPLAGESFRYRAWPMERRASSLPELRRLADWIDGDVIYANKPLAASYGVALWARLKSPRPLVLDIDDWDAAFVRDAWRSLRGWPRARYLAGSTLRPHLNHGLWNNLAFERMTSCADRRTVSNTFLADRFGGTLVRHGRDTREFRPGRWDRGAARRAHGIPENERIVAFLGTMHPYKGVDDLIDALAGMGDEAPTLLLVGAGDDRVSRATLDRARSVLGARIRCFGPQRFERVPEFLALADVAVIPQRDAQATLGQMPAKLFDAMALGIPAISTAVSDIPTVLDGAGWVVRPNDPPALREAIRRRFADPSEAQRRARLARRRCVEHYSFDAMERELVEIFGCF